MGKICGNCHWFYRKSTKHKKGICIKHSTYNIIKNELEEIEHETRLANTCRDFEQKKIKTLQETKIKTFYCKSWENLAF